MYLWSSHEFLHLPPVGLFSSCDGIRSMGNLSLDDKLTLVQHAILTFDTEPLLTQKLGSVMAKKDVERALDTLIATQRVRRIGSEKLQNNVSHTGELAPLSPELVQLLQGL